MGESEKLVAQLFSLARERSPSIVFIDEVPFLFHSSSPFCLSSFNLRSWLQLGLLDQSLYAVHM